MLHRHKRWQTQSEGFNDYEAMDDRDRRGSGDVWYFRLRWFQQYGDKRFRVS
jgi:hypothetical protein